MNEVALRANDVTDCAVNDVMLRINDVALRANGKLQFHSMSSSLEVNLTTPAENP